MAIETVRAPSAPFTYKDLLATPADGRRYELVDGVLLVTPSPNVLHQRAVSSLTAFLHPLARAAGYEVLAGPVDVRLAENRVLVPDVVVARPSAVGGQTVDDVPLLVVEVASLSTRAVDETLKRRAYEERGIPSYWLVDPVEPAVTVLELEAGRYVERARVAGEESFHANQPFEVTISPAALVGGPGSTSLAQE